MIILIIWAFISAIIIYICDKDYYWEHLSKVFLGASILALMFNGYLVYNPNLTTQIAIIELNPTWSSALLLSFVEGLCITGPIALGYIIYETILYRKKED